MMASGLMSEHVPHRPEGLVKMSHITPAELGRELGHNDGQRPGLTVRRYLRNRYPDHPKHQRWLLSTEEADDVRANLRLSNKG